MNVPIQFLTFQIFFVTVFNVRTFFSYLKKIWEVFFGSQWIFYFIEKLTLKSRFIAAFAGFLSGIVISQSKSGGVSITHVLAKTKLQTTSGGWAVLFTMYKSGGWKEFNFFVEIDTIYGWKSHRNLPQLCAGSRDKSQLTKFENSRTRVLQPSW